MADVAGPWWQGAVGYEIYVRSFLDLDGDGLGDLAGVRAKLPYLADLGIDIVWLSPFYPSPQADHGYDVADYLDVDPRFGSLDELLALTSEAHELGLRLVIDLVPNHTSDQHAWFLDSRTSREAEHRDFYVWQDPSPDGGPPNNWVSHFGGPAWTLDETTGQYFMHLFLPEQPDLNWAEPRVRAAFEDILEIWFSRGIDGVRIDVAHSLVEDPHFRDNPLLSEGLGQPTSADIPAEPTSAGLVFDRFVHVHDVDQPGVVDIYRDWNRVAAKHDALLLGEVYLLDPVRLHRYVTDDALHAAFCFDTLKVAWDADAIRDTLRPYVEESGDALAWPLSSHDDPHAATRFGGGELGARRALAYLTFLCGLPGSPFLFQGDELGLDDGLLDDGVATDPIAVRNPGATGRDAMRTPMVWEPGPGFGFTSGEPWLPFGSNRTDEVTVAAQLGFPGSHLERTRELLATRRHLSWLTDGSATEWITDEGPVVAIERGDEILVVLHVGDGDGPAELELPEGCRVAFATMAEVELIGDTLYLPEDSAAIIELDPAPAPDDAALDDDDRRLIEQATAGGEVTFVGADEEHSGRDSTSRIDEGHDA
jgi:alpha-glucosidase